MKKLWVEVESNGQKYLKPFTAMLLTDSICDSYVKKAGTRYEAEDETGNKYIAYRYKTAYGVGWYYEA